MPFTWTRAGDAAVDPANVSAASAGAVSSQAAAAQSPQRVKAGTMLRELFEYLNTNAEPHPTLAPAISVLSSAVAEYRIGRSPDPFSGVRAVYDAIQKARRADPSIPDP
jgi:hypothetical protein